MQHRLMRIAVAFLAAASLAWPAAAQWNSSAPAPVSPKSAVVESLRLGAAEASTPVRLEPIDATLIDAVKADNGKNFLKRLQIGIGREVDAGILASSTALRWVAVDGGLAARWEVTSPGARALRVGLSIEHMSPGIEIRFAGIAQADTVYGPFLAQEAMRDAGTYWSPVLEGESAIVEVLVPSGLSPQDFGATIVQVSHLFASPSDPAVESLAKAAGTCEVDLICRSASDAALADAGKAVAKMTFSDGIGGGTFLCTGTLLNPIGGTFIPYFYGANHCISTQASASTVTTHWFYDRTGCGSGGTSANYVQLPGGAQLLYADASSDGMLMRLNNPPPAGAVFSGWDATTIAAGTAVTAVHHPAGDVKKVSLGSVGGFGDTSGGSTPTFIISNWNSVATGVTEGGSSGSGLFTAVGQPATEYRLRGGLYGGPSSCTASASDLHDYYSRFDQVYPSLAGYLNPTASTCIYSLSPTSATVGSGAATGSLSVTTSCSWSASSNAPWLTTSSSGNGNGTISYSVAANTGVARTGTLTVAGQPFTVTQQAAGTGTNVVSNANFETGTAGWTQSASGGFPIITNGASVAHAGAWYAWLGGYDSANDTLYQQVFIPGNAAQATLQFWYNIQTSETTTSAAFDTMTVTLASATTGARLATLATFSNLNHTSGWVLSQQYDVSAFRGQSVRLVFQAITDVSNTSSFLVDDVNLAVTTATSSGGATSYEGLWLKGDESGWGVNITHQGTTVFATWFTYDTDGHGMWLVMSNGSQTSPGNFSGTLYRTVGPAFSANPFNSITFPANYTTVGTLSFAFTDANNGTMSYTVNGVSQTKPITRFLFAAGGTNCTLGGAQGASPNYQDLWLRSADGTAEAGWGINITHQGDILFATWFTYLPGSGSTNKGLWLVMSDGTKTAPGVYTGALQSTTGPAFNASPFNPSNVVRTTEGSGTFTFSDANNGTFSYTVGGVTQSKPIARYIFATPSTVCQ